MKDNSMEAQKVNEILGKKLEFILRNPLDAGAIPSVVAETPSQPSGGSMKWMIALVLLISIIGVIYYLMQH